MRAKKKCGGRHYIGDPASKAFVGPPSPFRRYLSNWRQSETRKHAYKMVSAAINAGMLPRANTLRCIDCNAGAHAWDHRDYARPLHVDPVCAACNFKRGPGMNSLCVDGL